MNLIFSFFTKKSLLIITMGISFSTNLFSQGDWKQYKPEYNNLPFYPDVNVINVDKFNNKWFGLNGYISEGEAVGGLVKFDGEKWTQYTTTNSPLPDNNITAIEFDLNDNTWIGMKDSGLAVIRNDTIELIKEPLQFIMRGTPKNILADKKGNIWVLYSSVKDSSGFYKSSALMKFDGVSWTNFNIDSIQIPEGSINTISLDKDGNLYCGSQDKILKYEGSVWTNIEVPGEDIRLRVTYLTFDPDNIMWVGSNGFGSIPKILLYNNGTWENTTSSYYGGEPSSIVFDKDGTVWISSINEGTGLTAKRGLAKYYQNNWEYFNRENSGRLWESRLIVLSWIPWEYYGAAPF